MNQQTHWKATLLSGLALISETVSGSVYLFVVYDAIHWNSDRNEFYLHFDI